MKKEIPLFKVFMSETASDKVKEVLNSGFIGQGQVVDQFESILTNYFQHPFITTVNSATSAEHLALHLIKKPYSYVKMDAYGMRENKWEGMSDGDEVLTTPMTCLYESSTVLLPDGTTPTISYLVNNKYDGDVVSFNVETNKFENKKVIGWYTSPLGERTFIRLSYGHPISNIKEGVWVTNDHKILTKERGWVRADELIDDELVATNKLNSEQDSTSSSVMLGESEVYYNKVKIIKGENPNTDNTPIKNVYCLGVKDNNNFVSGDIVVHNCYATNSPIIHNNFKIKWVDIDPKTLNMDLDDLERKITPKTKAIIVVHWGGYPVNLERLRLIQEKAFRLYGFKPAIIEDCAHAMGSSYKNNLIGTHGNICTFSLQAIKHITSVDGGLLFVPHEELNKRARLLRWYGIDRDDKAKLSVRCDGDIKETGFKFHMNDVNATIGICNFNHVDEIVSKHKKNGKYYDEKLKNINGLTLLDRHTDFESSFWIYSLLVERRGDFMRYMKECGISVSQVHERNDKHSAMKEFRTMLPNLDSVADNIISIPVGWWVNEEEREYIVNCIKKGW